MHRRGGVALGVSWAGAGDEGDMDGLPTPHTKRRARDPIATLERSGGAVWAFRRGRGSLLDLTYARRHGTDVAIEGTVRAESLAASTAVDAADAERLRGLLVDRLASIGWKTGSSGVLTRSWIIRSDLDRADLRRAVEQTIAVLAPVQGAEPSEYRLVYRPPGEEDAGNAQVGCVLAGPSVLIGDLLGGLVTVARDQSLPLLEVGIASSVVGFGLGFVVLGSLAPRVLALVPRWRATAAERALGLQVLLPGLVAFMTWLVLPVIGLRDGAALLTISAVIVVAGVVLPVPLMLLGLLPRGGGRRTR